MKIGPQIGQMDVRLELLTVVQLHTDKQMENSALDSTETRWVRIMLRIRSTSDKPSSRGTLSERRPVSSPL